MVVRALHQPEISRWSLPWSSSRSESTHELVMKRILVVLKLLVTIPRINGMALVVTMTSIKDMELVVIIPSINAMELVVTIPIKKDIELMMIIPSIKATVDAGYYFGAAG